MLLRDEFLTFMRAALPELKDLKLVKKTESALMRFLSIVMFFNRKFMSGYFTTLGNTIYIPEKDWEDQDWHTVMIMAHECQHIYDSKKWSVLYYMAYAFPQVVGAGALLSLLAIWFSNWWLLSLVCLVALAPLPAPGRVHFERRGYVINLVMTEWLYGYLNDSAFEWANKQFVSSSYYFMSWTSQTKNLERDFAMIKRGEGSRPVIDKSREFLKSLGMLQNL